MAREITQAEKAAIYYHLVGGCSDWAQLYRIAKGEDAYNGLSKESKAPTVSKWKNSDTMQKGIKDISCILQAEKKELEEKAVREARDEKGNPENLLETNFLDRDEFLQYLNKQANRIQDEKSRNETLKMISDNLRYKDMDKEGREDDLMRFYVPLTCHECPLYKQAKEEE